MAENVLGKIILDAGNRAGGVTGGGTPPVTGLLNGDSSPGGGGAAGDSTREAKANRFQKGVEVFNKKSLEFAAAQPRWFTSMFKKMGIQMGLAGILKQSQIFTGTIGSLFQIFGAFVDVLLAPLIRPLFIPILRWLARRIPDVARGSKAFFNFIGKTINWLGTGFKKSFWTDTVFSGLITFFTDTFPDRIKQAFNFLTDFGSSIWNAIKKGLKTAWDSTLGNQKINFGPLGSWTIPTWGGGGGSSAPKKNKAGVQWNEVTDSDGNVIEIQMKDEKGDVVSYEDPRTGLIESPYVPATPESNPKLAEFYKNQGIEPPSIIPTGDGEDKSWWQKIFDPEKWKSVFGDFKQQFKDFWSGSAISNVLKGVGVAVGGSLGYKVGTKMVSGLGASVKAVTWPLAKLVQLMNAAAKTPGMMGLNTAKWALRQMNIANPENIINTLKSKGFTEGGADLARRGLKTMGSGVSNAFLDAVRTGFDPFAKGWQATKSTVNWMTPGRESTGLFNTSKAVTEAAEEVKIPRITGDLEVPRISPRIDVPPPKVTPKATPPMPRPGPDIVSKSNRVSDATRKFAIFGDEVAAFIRGASSWTLESVQAGGAKIARLGNEALAAARIAEMPEILGKIGLMKSFVGRLVPFAASGIAIATTGKNIADIANMEHLSWWKPHEGMLEAQINPILDKMRETEERYSTKEDGFSFSGLWNRQAEQQQNYDEMVSGVMGSYMMGTKGGAVTTQALMGGADALLGFGGAVTLPLQAAIMAGQYGHMQGVQGYNQRAGEWTGTLDELMSATGLGLDAATIELAIEHGMSKALDSAKVRGVMDANNDSRYVNYIGAQ